MFQALQDDQHAHTAMSPVDDVDGAVGEPRILQQLHEQHTRARVTLRRLHHHRVACDEGGREHLQPHRQWPAVSYIHNRETQP